MKHDSYRACLKSILDFYDIQSDLDGIIESTPRETSCLTSQDLFFIADKLDLNIKETRIALNKLNTLAYPVILLLNSNKDDENEACVFYPDSRGSRGHFYAPASDQNELSFEAIKAKFDGRIYIISPKTQAGAIDTSHMSKAPKIDWFWTPIKAHWPRYVEIILCTLFINLLALAVPLFTMNVYDRVVINFAEETLLVLTLGVILALVFDFGFKLLRSYILERVASDISTKHDFTLMERLISLNDVSVGLSVGARTNIFRELQGIRDFYATRLMPTLVDIPFFVFFTLVIYAISPPLALVPIIAAAIVLVFNTIAQNIINKITARYFSAIQNKASLLVEMLGGTQTIRLFNAAGSRLLKWKMASENAYKSTFDNSVMISTISNFSTLITQTAYACVIFLGVYQIEQGALTIGGLIACSIIYSRAVAPIVGLSGILARLKQSRDVLRTIHNLFEIPIKTNTATNVSEKGPFTGQIVLRDVSYQYPDQPRPALFKNTLQINAGEHVGIIGQTGAGKTTLSKLIVNIMDPLEGEITLDGFHYNAIAETQLRRVIGYVPQDSFFFSGSMRENIMMGHHETISEDDLNAAIKLSGLDLVMRQTGEGLDTEVGENGMRLSGGQKQAISLARAVVRNPKVLVFDEPTTGMDNALEARVLTELKSFIQEKTFVMVTHRTSLLPLVDRLIVMDQGRIIADGPRDGILQKLSGGGGAS